MNQSQADAIMGIGFGAALGDSDRLRRAFDEAHGVVPRGDIEEYLLQTYLFAGFPRTINAFFSWQAWAVANGGRKPVAAAEPDDPEAWRARGEKLCRLVYGADFEALQRRLARLHPALADWTLVEGYGKVLSRAGPDAAGREIAAVGALIAVDAERQLASHLKGAIHAGVDGAILAAAARRLSIERATEARVANLLADLDAI